MNIINLKRAFNYMLTVKPEEFEDKQHYLTSTQSFDIGHFITDHQLLVWYSTVGKELESFQEPSDEGVDYPAWTESFLNLETTDDVYLFMFHSAWSKNPEAATLEQALLRMKFVIDFERCLLSWDFDTEMPAETLTPYEV